MKQQNTVKTLYSIILFLGVVLAVYSAYLFTLGFHNVDLGQNINTLNAYGLNLVDKNSEGNLWTGSEMYAHGLGQQKISFSLLGVSAFLIGFSLSKLTKIGE